MIGLNDNGGRYIEFALGLILTSNAAQSLGYALAIGAPSVQVALAMGMPIILPFILFGGLFINIDSIPKYFYWLRCALHILTITSHYMHYTPSPATCMHTCTPLTCHMLLLSTAAALFSYISFAKYGFELLTVIVWDGVESIECSQPPCAANSGQDVISQYGFSSSHVGEDIGVLIGLVVFFRFIAYLFLLRRSSSQL